MKPKDSLRSSPVLNRILIDFAVRGGYETILRILASMKVEKMDPGNVISQMASSVACLHGRGEVAKLLINSGCAVNLNGFGTTESISITPLLVAADRGYNSIVKSLLESGTDINVVDSEGSTALLLAISRKCRMANKKLQSRRSIIQMLLLAGAGIHTRNIEGNSPFFQALATYHRSIAELAYHFHAEYVSTVGYRRTLESLCICHYHHQILHLLVDAENSTMTDGPKVHLILLAQISRFHSSMTSNILIFMLNCWHSRRFTRSTVLNANIESDKFILRVLLQIYSIVQIDLEILEELPPSSPALRSICRSRKTIMDIMMLFAVQYQSRATRSISKRTDQLPPRLIEW